MSGLFRCAGDILFDDNHPMPGQISNVQLKKFSETSNFLQYKQPLTPQHPYFFAQIRSLASQSKITLGIAGPDIDNDAHPGHWNNTVGYHSDTGKCFTSHTDRANTRGERFSVGDMFGVLVTHFGENMSTVMFLKNGVPVATRYLFECEHSKFLPTLCLENGPIDLGIMWPQAAIGIPKFDERNMLNWIKDNGVEYDMSQKMFHYNKVMSEVTIQSPVPLSNDIVHYEVILEEAEDGESPAVGMATCSPIKPSPTCVLLRDFFRWKANSEELKATVGQRIGFGIHYNPDTADRPDFNDKESQLVLCFVTLDMNIAFFRMMMQPPGGFYPLIVLTRRASKVKLDVETNRDLGNESTRDLLDKIYRQKHSEASNVKAEDVIHRDIQMSMFRKSSDIEVDLNDPACSVRLSRKVKRIHTIQYGHPLLPDIGCYFCAEIVKLNEDSAISLGIGSSDFPLNKHPGKHTPSTGYYSRDGKMYFNEKYNGNIEGERFGEGDTIGVQVTSIDETGASVVLFIKNDRPVGTRFLSITDPTEFLPTISLCGNGYDVELHVFWQNRLSQAPVFSISNLEHWCLPENCSIDPDTLIATVKDHQKPAVFQCPHSLNDGTFNHFQIVIIDEFGGTSGVPPPVIALTASCTRDNVPQSNFRLEYLRFWPVGEAEAAVKVGDQVGWGMLVPHSQMDREERLVICYLTINCSIALTRVMFEPPGGLFPLVYLPADVNRVKFEFSGMRITSHPISQDLEDKLINEALEIYEREQAFIATGKDLDDFEIDKSRLLKPLETSESDNESISGDGRNGDRMYNAVRKAKGMKNVKDSIQSYKARNGQQSKACVIL